jgi:uncharacterized protein
LLGDQLSAGNARPKIVLDAYAPPTGFDVSGMITKVDEREEAESGAVHMNSRAILAFPNACFLWNVTSIHDISVESLSSVLLHRPKLEYLFIGTTEPIPLLQLDKIKKEFKEKGGIVVERLNLVRCYWTAESMLCVLSGSCGILTLSAFSCQSNAMGTFNILNGEDRPVAVALLLEPETTEQK